MALTQATFDKAFKDVAKKMEKNFANMQQNFQKEMSVLKDIITEKDSMISKLEETLEAQRTTLEKANERLLQLEVRDRRHNLILHGLPKENRGDFLEVKVRSVLKDKVDLKEEIKISMLFRLKEKSVSDRSNRTSAPPVLFTCSSDHDVLSIMKLVKNLKVGKKTVKGLGGRTISLTQDQHLKFMEPPCLKSIVIELVLESEVARHIQGLKGASSSGPDYISTKAEYSLEVNGKVISDLDEVSGNFANHFAAVGERIHAEISSDTSVPTQTFVEDRGDGREMILEPR
ncbi:hypothetical protein QYM36_020018, partial [Artemia franciscana]